MSQVTDTQPIVEEQPNTQIEENVPFKVFKTQEEYDNFAGYIRKSTTSSILEELGLQDKSQIKELRETITNVVAQNEELAPKVQQYEEQVKDLQLETNLLGLGIAKEDFDYVKVDLLKNPDLDITDQNALSEFLGNTRWVKPAGQEQQTQQTPTPDVQPTIDTSNLSVIEANAFNAFLGR